MIKQLVIDKQIIRYWTLGDVFFFTHLKLCLATATHKLKWVKITHICLIWDLSFANPDV